jgi:diguanylate cyclase (GGDEF)-like protein
MIQLTLWSISPLLVTLVAVGIYLRLARKPRLPGIPAFRALVAVVVFWSGCQFAESLFAMPLAKLAALKASYVGIALAPVLWLLFAIGYARRQVHIAPALRNALGVVPLITLLLVFSNAWHGLMWQDVRLVSSNGFNALVTDPGPWFYVNAVYAYGLMMVATTILAFVLATTTRHRLPVIGVVLAPLVVSVANLLYLLPANPVPWFDLTTLGVVVAAMILDRTVLRHGVLDNIPVLRDRVLEQLAEGVVVVAADGRIIDVNQVAVGVLGGSRTDVEGTPIDRWLPDLNPAAVEDGRSGSQEIQAHGRYYDVSGARLDPDDPSSDVVLALRDVTVRRDTELALRVAQDELQRLVHTDSLTGLHNRRLFMDRLDEEVRRVQRHDGCLSVILIDLDHFKQINDRFGHDVGDRVLVAAAARTRSVKRATDVAARIGGEEFALLLPATDAAGALHLARRVCSAIEAIDTQLLLGDRVTVTASIGVATVSAGADAPSELLRRADQALYRAKNGGRNRVCVGDEQLQRAGT